MQKQLPYFISFNVNITETSFVHAILGVGHPSHQGSSNSHRIQNNSSKNLVAVN